ncbi:auxilin-like clathrin-binding protein required for normal clathrin function [Basidiobolus ranarum]|uniref:Auxilin-like clathrin-binding protein required for normal clathrin function n=1 Tax=Basidiobolus ranarum TaxID=34480 RepID=A0ABR2WW44_9FUNG
MEEEDSRPFNSRGKSPSVDADLDHLIAQVMEMGFEPEQARSALELSNKDVQAAIDILVENRNAEEEIIHDKRKNIPSLPRKTTSGSRDRFTHPSKMNWERQESGEGSGFDMASFQVHKEKFI